MSVEEAQQDVREMLLALDLGDHARPASCHEIIQGEILPAIIAARSQTTRLSEAVRDVCWKATAYGVTPDGDVAAYILPKGPVHRLVGAAQCAGISASLRAEGVSAVWSEDRQVIEDAQRLRDATAATHQTLPESVRILDRLIELAQRAL